MIMSQLVRQSAIEKSCFTVMKRAHVSGFAHPFAALARDDTAAS